MQLQALQVVVRIGHRVLVVETDDEPDVELLFRQQFRRDLRDGRFTMDFAQSGYSALQCIHDAGSRSLILILSDINMPGMTGLELLPKARAARPDVPIIMITAYGDAETKRKAARRKASVLVIDDDPDVREFICGSLTDFGYGVREAVDGPAGLKAFAEKRPDLVIVDYAMPAMSGSEVAARMLRDVPGQPILFVSGYSETEAIRAAAPDAQLLQKPFRPDALDAAVRECLDSKRTNGGKKPAA